MRRYTAFPLAFLLAAAGCSDDPATGTPPASYSLHAAREDVSWNDASEAVSTTTKDTWIAAAGACFNTLTPQFLPSADGSATVRGRVRARVVSNGSAETIVQARIMAAVDNGTGFGTPVEIATTTASGAGGDVTLEYQAQVPIGTGTSATIQLRPEVQVSDPAATPSGEASCVHTAAPANQISWRTDDPLGIGQDSAARLIVDVTRPGLDTVVFGSRILYSSSNYRIATVDAAGNVTGLSGGDAVITAKLGNASVQVPVTVRPYPAESVALSVLTGPAGGLRGTGNDEAGMFYALPADPLTSRLKGLVLRGNDTLFCNYCTARPSGQPPRVMRVVRFRSLDPTLATVSNAANPTLQTSTDTSGRVTPLDTSSTGVRIVMEVPGDSAAGGRWADTVHLTFSMRPLDTLRVRPDSNMFPTTNGTGLTKMIYPFSDTVQANVVAATTTNFIAGLDFLARVQNPPNPGSTAPGAVRFIPARITGGPTVRRGSLPNVTWESANTNYLTINAAGALTGLCAQIGGTCLASGSSVLTCTSTQGAMPAAFLGQGSYSIPSCNTPPIPMPGAFCTAAAPTADLTSTCTIWIRASATDPVSGKLLRRLYRVNIRR